MIRGKRIFIFFIGLALGINNLFAQEKASIDFKDVSFNAAKQLSAKTGKLIFIDCYTSWCMPCKWMEQNVFTNDTVYNFFNANFINFKIDMEKGEGTDLRKKYEVNSFPTYLFVNASGGIVHRTASRMEAGEFLNAAKRAIDPSKSYAALEKMYNGGNRSDSVLFAYAIALERINRQKFDSVRKQLMNSISDETLATPFGWQVIRNLASNEDDKFGKYLLQHKIHFTEMAGEPAVTSILNRLSSYKMYEFIRENNKLDFFTRLNQMKKDPDPMVQRNVAMFETEYYLSIGNADSFVVVANTAMQGILQFNDADLSFIARRASYLAKDNKEIEQEALLLARKAVELNPEEYSNQGTLASICLQLGRKDEGLKAAKKARLLADDLTSKIQGLAQALVDKIEALK